MIWAETDLRDMKTGDSIECIYSGESIDEAWEVANKYNKEHVKGWTDESYVDDFIGTESGMIADTYCIEDPEKIHGVGKW